MLIRSLFCSHYLHLHTSPYKLIDIPLSPHALRLHLSRFLIHGLVATLTQNDWYYLGSAMAAIGYAETGEYLRLDEAKSQHEGNEQALRELEGLLTNKYFMNLGLVCIVFKFSSCVED